jgi:hypothetical protein
MGRPMRPPHSYWYCTVYKLPQPWVCYLMTEVVSLWSRPRSSTDRESRNCQARCQLVCLPANRLTLNTTRQTGIWATLMTMFSLRISFRSRVDPEESNVNYTMRTSKLWFALCYNLATARFNVYEWRGDKSATFLHSGRGFLRQTQAGPWYN